MIPAAFDYHAPASLEEALDLLASHEDAKLLAGGQSLIPMMRFRLAEPGVIVDLGRVDGLAGIVEEEGGLWIGAMTRHADVEASDPVRVRYPLLHDAASVIADPIVRNRGTVAGSLVHADPAGDWGSVMLACRAELEVHGPDGERTVAMDDLFVTTFMTSLSPGEIVTGIRLPPAGERSGGAYEKLERKVGDFATVAVAARLELAGDGTCESAGIALTAVGATNLRAAEAEEALVGAEPDEEAIAGAAKAAAGASNPTADNRGSVEYKRDMVRVLTERALRRAAARARGEA
ncbi:MAG TPA: xanthine dehydrogenase family protein subunit M [Gemmatimonadota bacterium]|nr:xanthine dehydrogenase family protein subunit M [Gemmatimonadota bacterium]